jgi:hypothetical protein
VRCRLTRPDGYARRHGRTRHRRDDRSLPRAGVGSEEAAAASRGRRGAAGVHRQAFIAQAKLDYQDFAIIGDAEASIDDGILTLTIDLRPADQRTT